MTLNKEIEVGMEIEWERGISEEDIRTFAQVSGDKGRHHLEKDPQGRLMAHGLLVATLPTKLGGDLNYIARSMRFDFIKPAYSGDQLKCVGRVEKVLKKSKRQKITFSFKITNQDGELITQGVTSGVIYQERVS